jgi:hypothetical protein
MVLFQSGLNTTKLQRVKEITPDMPRRKRWNNIKCSIKTTKGSKAFQVPGVL